MPANTERATAGRNLLIYTGLVAVVAAYTALIWAECDELEGFEYPTGLADYETYDIEANPLDPDKPMALLDGVAYFAEDKPIGRWDRDVVKVSRDDHDQYFFYQATSVIGGGIEEGGDLYLKLAQDSYIKVSPAVELSPPPVGD